MALACRSTSRSKLLNGPMVAAANSLNVGFWLHRSLKRDESPVLGEIGTASRVAKRPRLTASDVSMSGVSGSNVALTTLGAPDSQMNVTAEERSNLLKVVSGYGKIHKHKNGVVRELKELIDVAPEFLRNKNLYDILFTPRALSQAVYLMSEYKDNIHVQQFFKARFWEFTQCMKPTESLPKRDELIEQKIINPQVNESVIRLLTDDAFRDFIFPKSQLNTYNQDDLEKLKLVISIVETGFEEVYDFVKENLESIRGINSKSEFEKVKYAICVAIGNLSTSGGARVPRLDDFIKMPPIDLARTLLSQTSPDHHKDIETILKCDKSSSKLLTASAKLLSFFAEHPDYVKVLIGAKERLPNLDFGTVLKRLHKQSIEHLSTFLELLKQDTCPITAFAVQHPNFLLGLSQKECTKLVDIVLEYNSSSRKDGSFYELKPPINQLHFYCEIIRGLHKKRAVVAESVATKRYRSEQVRFVRAFEHYLMDARFKSTRIDARGLSLAGFHRKLVASPSQYTEASRDKIAALAYLVRTLVNERKFDLDTLMTIPDESALFHQVTEEEAHKMLTVIDQGFLHLLDCKNPTWREFLRMHLTDICNFSRNSSRTLTKLFDFLNSPSLPSSSRATLQINTLHAHWKALIYTRNDQEINELLEMMIDTVVNPLLESSQKVTNVHDYRLVGRVAKTAASLLKAYESAGWAPNIIEGAKGLKVIEPVSKAMIEEQIELLKSELNAQIVANAEKLHEQRIDEAGVKTTPISPQEAVAKLSDKFEEVKKIARFIAKLEPLLSIEKKSGRHPQKIEELESKLINLRAQLSHHSEFTKPYGALQYLTSKHTESAPKKFVQSDLPCLSLKQMLGMVLCLPKLGEAVHWCDGMDTQAKRQEGVKESLISALNDSHIAYIGTKFDDNDSCWDGGASRLMLTVRNVIKFNLLPEPGDFAEEFLKIVKSKFNWLGSADLQEASDRRSCKLKKDIQKQVKMDIKDENEGLITTGLFEIIEEEVLNEVYSSFPEMKLPKLSEQSKAMIKENVQNLCYLKLPEAFRVAYST